MPRLINILGTEPLAMRGQRPCRASLDRELWSVTREVAAPAGNRRFLMDDNLSLEDLFALYLEEIDEVVAGMDTAAEAST